MAVVDALRAGEPRWLEDFSRDSSRYLLIGEPPERWQSRVWLPLRAGDGSDVCIGVLRGRPGAFTERDRTHLRGVVRLCAGRLRSFTSSTVPLHEAEADAVQSLFAALPVPALMLTPVTSSSGDVEDFRVDAATTQAADLLGVSAGDLTGRRLRRYGPTSRTCRCGGVPRHPGGRRAVRERAVRPPGDRGRCAGADHVLGAGDPAGGRAGRHLAAARLLGPAGTAAGGAAAAGQHRLGQLEPVPDEASWSAQVFAILDRDPADGPVRLDGLPELALPEDRPALRAAVEALLREGRPFDAPFRVRGGRGVRHLRLVAEVVADSRGTLFDVHGVVQDLTARRRAELALVESERAILTQHDVLQSERVLVARLQHALLPLPDKVVDLSGLRAEVAYLPAQAGIHVGGDWFSAVELPDGARCSSSGTWPVTAWTRSPRWRSCGSPRRAWSAPARHHGRAVLAELAAAALLGRARHRDDGHSPLPPGRPPAGVGAGLPPAAAAAPRRRGDVSAPTRGMLLGATTAPYFEETEHRLEPGDRLLLFTDGLVERAPRTSTSASHASPTRRRPTPRTPRVLGTLLDVMLVDERRDDVCVLDIRVPKEM